MVIQVFQHHLMEIKAEISYVGWGSPTFLLHCMVRELETRFDIIKCEVRIGSKQVSEIWVMRQVRDNPLHRNPGAFDNRFPDHNIRIRRNPIFAVLLFVCHSYSFLR
jgi:hypothetical protein